MKITLAAGRAHLKHTEGGDFRQATYRALRQGLMQAQSILLEPYYHFRLSLPQAQVGRAIGDLRAMSASFSQEQAEELAVLTGSVPVSALGSYAMEVAAYTRGGATSAALPAATLPAGIRNRSWQKPAMTRRQIWTIPRTPSSVPMEQASLSSGRRSPPICIWNPVCARPLPRLRHHGEGIWTTGSWKP